MILPEDWCPPILAPGVTLDLPGIYQWHIDDGIYVGRSLRLARRRAEYRNNLNRMLAGLPYHIAGLDFRDIHWHLYHAVLDGRTIGLHIVENVELEHLLHRRARELIELNGTLNRTTPNRVWR